MRHIRRGRVVALLAVAALTVAASACSSSSTSNTSTVKPGTATSLTISNESGTTWTCGFNPFNPDVDSLSFGLIYEELTFVNVLKSGATTPWLASAYTWSNNNKTLTFTIRPGVKWSDGQPFSAKDVVFTFNLLKKFPALDLDAVWSVLSSVSQVGSNKVAFQFSTSAVPYFYYIADETPIVPEHIWASIANPVTYNDASPVGTGPYTMGSCSAEDIEYAKNADYWQPGLPKIDKVYYPSFTSNDPANELLATGGAQWGSQFIPSIQSYYLSKSSDFHIWFPPVANVTIFLNLTNPVLSQLPVREAMAYAIDRPKVSELGEYGYEPPSNQTDVVSPTFSSWYDASAASQYNDYAYDPSKAMSILKNAGYTEKNGVFQTPKGPLSFTIDNIGGYSDWVASVSIVESELKAVGISITPDNLAANVFFSDLYDGDYQLAYNSETGGPSPYYELRQLLYSKNSAPIGQAAASNWERYSNPATDALIEQYGATTDAMTQRSIVDSLEKVMLSDVPVIPITEEVDWYQYDSANIGGWATAANPYAQPAAYDFPDIGVMLLHLYPKS
ncbi:MAG: ABC transporter substrate-binding protein [Acidimicrobiales bacterium]|jgi:peptide/nickel transport system substrate-binding protein